MLTTMQYYPKYKEIIKDNLIFSYTGLINMDVIAQLLQLTETTLITNGIQNRQKKSIINILIEGLQNILYHGENQTKSGSDTAKECLLMLGKEDDAYFIIFGNFILNNQVALLQTKLNKLTSLNSDELKHLYLQTLDNEEFSPKGGASLGLVKIFLDSKRQTSFDFEKINNEFSFFTLQIKVHK